MYGTAPILCVDIPNLKHLDKYKVSDRVHGDHGWISFNKTVLTENTVTHNKPDIVVTDKRKNTITLVEIGITSKERLTQVEIEKKHKYEPLTKQMGNAKLNEATKFRIVPYVMTWDGLVTKYHNGYKTELGITDRMEAQIQRVCLQITHEIVMRELGLDPLTEQPGGPERKRRDLGIFGGTLPELPDPRQPAAAVAPAVLCAI
ncbi:hypothetical protein X943_002931 [Babesia divergens]|uniref:Uncharacterized protein n=1 Tax=Babesia divergens TaxID=32595 RepID=A0AAD9G7N1_BABDI|nr:hypothetical protein X943_002931 [Babesia divergens]